jgi:hypothetical protein
MQYPNHTFILHAITGTQNLPNTVYVLCGMAQFKTCNSKTMTRTTFGLPQIYFVD